MPRKARPKPQLSPEALAAFWAAEDAIDRSFEAEALAATPTLDVLCGRSLYRPNDRVVWEPSTGRDELAQEQGEPGGHRAVFLRALSGLIGSDPVLTLYLEREGGWTVDFGEYCDNPETRYPSLVAAAQAIIDFVDEERQAAA